MWPGSELGLSHRESEVLALLARGLSNRLVAAELFLGEETIKTDLRSVNPKAGGERPRPARWTIPNVRNRTDGVGWI